MPWEKKPCLPLLTPVVSVTVIICTFFLTAKAHLTFPISKNVLLAFAADEDGNLLWNTQILPPSLKTAIDSGNETKVKEELEDTPHRVFGINYHPVVDAYIIADFSGDVMAFDR
jgi:hypothetical protein